MLRVFLISLTGAAIRWLRNEPTSLIKTWEDLKTKFLNKYCPPGRTAKKIEEINNFQQELDETFFQTWERFKELLMKCPQHYLTEMQETAEEAKKDIQEMVEYSQKWYNGTSRGRSTETSDGLAAIQAQLNNLGREIKKGTIKGTTQILPTKNGGNLWKIHEENSNLIKEIRAMTDAAIRNQGALIKTLEIKTGQMSKVLQERGFGSLPSLTETNLRDQVKSISATIEADSHSKRHIGSS
ncbi:ribonuclease H-like domain-containing protein [Tanacetum coccineum]